MDRMTLVSSNSVKHGGLVYVTTYISSLFFFPVRKMELLIFQLTEEIIKPQKAAAHRELYADDLLICS